MYSTRGRPKLDDDAKRVPVTVRVTTREYDRMATAASRDRVSLVEWMRRKTRESDRSE